MDRILSKRKQTRGADLLQKSQNSFTHSSRSTNGYWLHNNFSSRKYIYKAFSLHDIFISLVYRASFSLYLKLRGHKNTIIGEVSVLLITLLDNELQIFRVPCFHWAAAEKPSRVRVRCFRLYKHSMFALQMDNFNFCCEL